jgi:hypothetical protein
VAGGAEEVGIRHRVGKEADAWATAYRVGRSDGVSEVMDGCVLAFLTAKPSARIATLSSRLSMVPLLSESNRLNASWSQGRTHSRVSRWLRGPYRWRVERTP